ncbi:serpin family protein [Arthrobacter crystallopoietes]|uniref:serpin family protein n=1 Tax=Crystallibacter crystallopoietes TaxID=37928 RepID=UPI001FC96023|nr:serpin family protein [Arthrobacter crystallopoietes]
MRNRTTAVLAALGLVPVLTLAGCSAPEPELLAADGVQQQSVALHEYPEAAASLQDATLKLGAAMLAGRPEANQVTSPASLLYALAMLRAGAGTTTAAEMDAALGLPAQGRDEAMNALLTAWQEHDGDPGSVDEDEPPVTPLLHLANGVFVDAGTPTGEEYLARLAEHYGSGVYPVDYADPATKDKLDAWVDHNTGGRITEAPGGYDEDNTLTLLNAVYFAAAWADPFSPSSTKTEDFTLLNGEVIQAEAMGKLLRADYARGEGWQGMDLPYNEGFLMRLVLPDEGSPVLDEAALATVNRAMAAANPARVSLGLPKWEHDYTQNLIPVLRGLGLAETLGPAPDLHAIQPEARVTGATQQANITVGEKGTVAAAVTQLDVMAGSLPPPPDVKLDFNRPFLYQIIHAETGLPLFLGTVMDPR